MIENELDCEATPRSGDPGDELDVATPQHGSGTETDGIASRILSEVQRMLPNLLHGLAAPKGAPSPSESEELRSIREEVAAARLEVQQLRAHKLAQDRELFLKEQIRSLGVRNVDLAFRAVRDDVEQAENGAWMAVQNGERVPALQYLQEFVAQNPELIPARIAGGSGVPSRPGEYREECDLDQIRPGMDPASLRRAKEAVVRIIAQSKRSL